MQSLRICWNIDEKINDDKENDDDFDPCEENDDDFDPCDCE